MKAIAICGCILAVSLAVPAAAQASAFVGANLLGQEVPGGKGDDKASANFNGEVDPKAGTVCYYLDMDGLKDANAVSLQKVGAADTDPPVLPLKVPGPGGDETCVSGDKTVIAAIAAEPGQYYVDIDTPGHPEGAVRGNLKK